MTRVTSRRITVLKTQSWLSDGWATINERSWSRPLYWDEELATEFTIGGSRELDLNAPVSHVSYYEADAFERKLERNCGAR